MAFQSGSLYALFFYRGNSYTWHWSLFLAAQSSQTLNSTGVLFHCKNDPSMNKWEYQVCQNYNPGASLMSVVLVVRLADLRTLGDSRALTELFHSHLRTVRVVQGAAPSTFDCKKWFFNAVRALAEGGIVTCESITELERELSLRALQATPVFESQCTHSFAVSQRCCA